MTEPTQDFGSRLQDARERSGRSLREIADATKLSVRNLRLLESNRVDQLPGGIYRRAIVRTYASQVGLDPEATLKAFLDRYPDDVPTWADLVPTRPAPARRPWHALLSILGALVPILAGAVYFSSGVGRLESPPSRLDIPVGGEFRQASLVPASLSLSRPYDAMAMMISVSASTSLQVVADGREVAVGRFDAGDVIRLTLASEVVLVGDDAGAVHFSINGRAGRRLGDAGAPLTARISRADYQGWLIQP